MSKSSNSSGGEEISGPQSKSNSTDRAEERTEVAASTRPNLSPFHFSHQSLECVVGGRSVLDIPRLDLRDKAEARQFLLSYGYDLAVAQDREEMSSTFRRALAMIREQLMEEGESIPSELTDPTQLEDLADLLMLASQREPGKAHLQRWACAILRVMHVYVHLRNDLFSAFRDEIQQQVLAPIESAVSQDLEGSGVFMLREPAAASALERVQLERFDVKPFKTTASAVIKLLARPERVALTLLDKIGVRFVTRGYFDSYRVVRMLIDQNIVSFPHIIPDQSTNTLFPLNVFNEAMDELEHSQAGHGAISDEFVEKWLERHYDQHAGRAEFQARRNDFSGPDHRFIKFIARRLVTVPNARDPDSKPFRFFYPFEVQIMDRGTFERQSQGPTAHEAYKERQKKAARERVFGLHHEVL
jgi:uncharacterized protein (TIGR04562 family)